jgi:hypothetical protein
MCCISLMLIHLTGGSRSVLRGSQGICDQFPGEPWIHLCNGYSEVYLFFKLKEWCFVKSNRGTSVIGDMFTSCDRQNS